MQNNKEVWLVTGAAGFIGMHVCQMLLRQGKEVVGIDNLNDYYEVSLKLARLRNLEALSGFEFYRADVADANVVKSLFETRRPEYVVHLAAQAGVRYSLINPQAYIESNIQGFLNILEGARHHPVKHLVYASSSSVYGANTLMPFAESHNVDHPVSLYAATKKSNELMAHAYSHLFRIPSTGLRFFTVYGPWGRPDMAPMLFIDAILKNRPIDVFNNGQMTRDFTYVDDIAEAVIRVAVKPPPLDRPSTKNTLDKSEAPYRVFNIGNGAPTQLLEFIRALEEALGKKAALNYLPMQPGDVQMTSASVERLHDWISFRPSTPVRKGVENFVNWHRKYNNI